MVEPTTSNIQGDLEQLRGRFEEFRKTQTKHARLPDSLWAAAAETRRGFFEIQFLLDHISIQTTGQYLGCKQNLRDAVNDKLGLEDL